MLCTWVRQAAEHMWKETVLVLMPIETPSRMYFRVTSVLEQLYHRIHFFYIIIKILTINAMSRHFTSILYIVLHPYVCVNNVLSNSNMVNLWLGSMHYKYIPSFYSINNEILLTGQIYHTECIFIHNPSTITVIRHRLGKSCPIGIFAIPYSFYINIDIFYFTSISIYI